VRIFDSHLKKHFTLRAIIFCIINDFSAYGNLSGYKNKGFKACPICRENTHSIRLTNNKKNVYLGHRRFLGRNHPYRRSINKDKFDGKEEQEKTPMPFYGKQVYM
jgi:Transposase family tnp2